MGVIAVYSPRELLSGSTTTQYIANPFAKPDAPTSNVWIDCTLQMINIWDTAAFGSFGIIEYEYVDNKGNIQTATFGDINNLNNLTTFQPTRMFVRGFLSVTVVFVSYNVSAQCRVVLWNWS
jgi:hypothetical protein